MRLSDIVPRVLLSLSFILHQFSSSVFALSGSQNDTIPAPTSVSTSNSPYETLIDFDPGFGGTGDLTIWIPWNEDYVYLPHTKPHRPLKETMKKAVTWKQVFILTTASVFFIAGAGVARDVLHDPLGTAEGVLNFPVLMSSLSVIFTSVYLIDNTVYTFDPNAVITLIEQISIVAASFTLLTQMGLETLFALDKFPNSVEDISSYGGATLFHAGLIALHGVQVAVLKWEALIAYLRKEWILMMGIYKDDLPFFKTLFKKDDGRTQQYLRDKDFRFQSERIALTPELRDALQQSRDILRCTGQPDPNHSVDLNACKSLALSDLTHLAEFQQASGGHSHGHGVAAILADVIAHGASLPTFFVAWVLVTAGVEVSALGVAWFAQLSTIILLGALIHSSKNSALEAWKLTGGEVPATITNELQSKIQAEFQPVYGGFVERVEFAVRQVSQISYKLFYVSFYVFVYPDRYQTFANEVQESGKTRMTEAELQLRKIAYEVKAYDFTKLDRGLPQDLFKMVYWLLSDTNAPNNNTLGRRDTFKVLELEPVLAQEQVTYLFMQHMDSFDIIDPLMKNEAASMVKDTMAALVPLKDTWVCEDQ